MEGTTRKVWTRGKQSTLALPNNILYPDKVKKRIEILQYYFTNDIGKLIYYYAPGKQCSDEFIGSISGEVKGPHQDHLKYVKKIFKDNYEMSSYNGKLINNGYLTTCDFKPDFSRHENNDYEGHLHFLVLSKVKCINKSGNDDDILFVYPFNTECLKIGVIDCWHGHILHVTKDNRYMYTQNGEYFIKYDLVNNKVSKYWKFLKFGDIHPNETEREGWCLWRVQDIISIMYFDFSYDKIMVYCQRQEYTDPIWNEEKDDTLWLLE